MAISRLISPGKQGALATVAGAALAVALTACNLPLGIGTATERALESGAEAGLSSSSFEITGSYNGAGVTVPSHVSGARTSPAPPVTTWSIDLQLTRPSTQHMTVSGTNLKIEAIILGKDAYFRGQQFLSDHMGDDPLSRDLVSAAGNAWWKGSADLAPQLPDFTSATAFRSTFLGSAVTQRSDNVAVDGVDAVNLSGPRADVFIAAQAPYELLRVHMKTGAAVDGIVDADLKYGNFGKNFGTAAPTGVIDFSNLSTLPPIYTVVSVNTASCGSPCVVSALVKNLGGLSGAKAASTVTFTMTESATGSAVGSCQVPVIPDVGYNATTTVSCTIDLHGQQVDAAIVTATADNPGRA